ncbi:MAG TPA: hypothetical protein VMY35_14550 [Phycisphaerae bacterium]|nr:hypothetical protein [Phycisphaerae bacterium]
MRRSHGRQQVAISCTAGNSQTLVDISAVTSSATAKVEVLGMSLSMNANDGTATLATGATTTGAMGLGMMGLLVWPVVGDPLALDRAPAWFVGVVATDLVITAATGNLTGILVYQITDSA